MSFLLKTAPTIQHNCILPDEYFIDKNGFFQPSYGHPTIWKCDKCNKYYIYKADSTVLFSWWKQISEKKAIKIKYKWLNN